MMFFIVSIFFFGYFYFDYFKATDLFEDNRGYHLEERGGTFHLGFFPPFLISEKFP